MIISIEELTTLLENINRDISYANSKYEKLKSVVIQINAERDDLEQEVKKLRAFKDTYGN